jgi:hypothetical protein
MLSSVVIPNEVNVTDFVKDPDATSKGMSNLCRAAGLSVQKIRELAATSDTAQREAYEDHYKGTISGGLNEFWTQAEYHVHFRIEKERLSVSISDGTYTQRIPPSDRSEGFQWYLSFYATLLNDVGVSNQTILLLDNPVSNFIWMDSVTSSDSLKRKWLSRRKSSTLHTPQP